MKRIDWAKMHLKNYDGSCVYCGGACLDEDSKCNWALALKQLSLAEHEYRDNGNVKYGPTYRYLKKRISNCLNFLN